MTDITAGGIGIIVGAGVYVLLGAATAQAGARVAREGRPAEQILNFARAQHVDILLLRIGSAEAVAILPSVLRAHRFWRGRGISVDVVILNERALGYVPETDDHVDRAIAQAGADAWRDRPGGVFVVHAARLDEADRILLLSAARVVLDGSEGSIGQQLAASTHRLQLRLPEKSPLRCFHQNAVQSGNRDHKTQQRQRQRL